MRINPAEWQATLPELRTAWVVAALCMVLVLTASLQPQWFDFSTPKQLQNTRIASLTPTGQPTNKPENNQVEQGGRSAKHSPVEKPAKQRVVKVLPRADGKQLNQVQAKPLSKQTGKAPVRLSPAVKPHTQALHPAATGVPANGFYVQIGAFGQRSSASKLVAQLKQQGWKAVQARTRGGLHAVWIGPKRTRAEADQLLKSIQHKLKYKGFIVHQKLA